MLQQLLIWFIYLVVAIMFYHYALPKKVRSDIRKYMGMFFKWLLFGRKPGEKKKASSSKDTRVKEFSWAELEKRKKL